MDYYGVLTYDTIKVGKKAMGVAYFLFSFSLKSKTKIKRATGTAWKFITRLYACSVVLFVYIKKGGRYNYGNHFYSLSW